MYYTKLYPALIPAPICKSLFNWYFGYLVHSGHSRAT